MKLYYQAINQEGKKVKGIIEAKDAKDAGIFLRKHQLIPITIDTGNKLDLGRYFGFLSKASGKDLVFFTRQLASMLSSGLTLMQALNIMKGQIKNPAMAEVLQGLISKVEDGVSFSVALEKYPRLFSPIYVALIRAAESSGLLDKVLTRLADNLEKRAQLHSSITGALVYPIIVIIMMISVVAVMMIFAIPQLSNFYESMGVDLPLPTLLVIETSNFMVNYWWIAILGGFISLVGFKKWHQQEGGRLVIDTLILRIPLVGKLISQSLMVDFARTFGLLVGTGSLVVDSLLKSADVVDNVVYRKEVIVIAKRVEKGISVGDAIEAGVVFPSILVQMIKIGEQTGKLDDSLSRVAEYYEREVEQTVKALTTALEPAIMVVLGLGVGFLIMAVITPIYKVISAIQ